MKKTLNKTLLFFIFILAKLPMRWLYVLSNFLYILIYKTFGYRKKVVKDNLKKSFPNKTEDELLAIEKNYYHYLCDLIVENVKLFKITSKEAEQMIDFNSEVSLIHELHNKNQSAIVVMAHYGNWELVCKCSNLMIKNKTIGAYKPLSNEVFDTAMKKSREEFGTEMISMKEIYPYLKSQSQNYMMVLIADQSPSSSSGARWVNFLNQDTVMLMGGEKLSNKLKLPVYYLETQRIKRGRYRVLIEKLEEDPFKMETFFHRIEKSIQTQPETWLWSHRRWKLKRE